MVWAVSAVLVQANVSSQPARRPDRNRRRRRIPAGPLERQRVIERERAVEVTDTDKDVRKHATVSILAVDA